MSNKIQGSLKIMSLPDVLQWIGLAQKTGSLIFEKDKEKKVLFFRKGAVIGANSNNPKDKVGEILIRMEKITREELDQGLIKQKETGDLIGDILLARGYLTTKDFITALESPFKTHRGVGADNSRPRTLSPLWRVRPLRSFMIFSHGRRGSSSFRKDSRRRGLSPSPSR